MTTRPMTARRGSALLAGLIVATAACASDADESAVDEVETVETAVASTTPSTTGAASGTEVTVANTEPASTTLPPVTVSPPVAGGLLDFEFQPVPAGDYRVETIGAPFTITVPEGWWVQPNSLGHFVITDETSQGPGDLDIVMLRPSNLADPDDPGAPPDDQRGDWPLDDIEGWLDALTPGVVADGPEPGTLGGLDAVRFDVELTDEVACGPDFCVGFATNRRVNGMWFDRRIGYRVWWIDGRDEAPIAVVIGDGGDPAFVERAEAVLDTVEFESVGPNPIPAEGNLWELGIPAIVSAGTVSLPAGPGVTFELTQDRHIHQQGPFVAIAGEGPFETDIFFPETSASGAPIETADDVIAALEETAGITVDGIGAREVDGRESVEVSFTGPGLQPDVRAVFPFADDPRNGWRPPIEGRMWILELDDGVVFVTAEIFETGFMDEALELAETILGTISFGP